MSLAEEVAAVTATSRKGLPCGVATVLDALDAADRADLRTLLESEVAGVHIARALTNRGHEIKGHTIQRHRHGDCACGR